MPSIGPMEIIIVLALLLIVFGPKRLPELGRGMGGGLREFKSSVADGLPGTAAEAAAEQKDPQTAAKV